MVSYWIYFLLFSIRTCFFKGKNLIFSISLGLGMMIEGYSNLSKGGTFNVGSISSYSCFLLCFKMNPSTSLQVNKWYGQLFYSTAEIRMEYCIETVMKGAFSDRKVCKEGSDPYCKLLFLCLKESVLN